MSTTNYWNHQPSGKKLAKEGGHMWFIVNAINRNIPKNIAIRIQTTQTPNLKTKRR
jgi:hypothetical protein